MKRNNRVFFHPVLSDIGNDYNPQMSFNLDVDVTIADSLKVAIDPRVSLNNPSILETINSGNARIYIDIRCSKTLFRDLRELPQLGVNPTILLESGVVFDAVEMQAYVFASKSIEHFKPFEANPDYGDYTFQIPQGAPLAISNSVLNDISFDRQNFQNFLYITVNENLKPGTYEFNFNNDKIVAMVSKDVAKVLEVMKSNKDLKPYSYTSFYKDCITSAVELLALEGSERRWSLKLQNRIQSLGEQLENLKSFADYNRVALKLLAKDGYLKVAQNA